jgi:hypothetical protein
MRRGPLGKLFISGLDHFWFALCMCVAGSWMTMRRTPEEKQSVAVLCLPKLLRWWPILCGYDQRFSSGQLFEERAGSALARGWPQWGSGLGRLCEDLGISTAGEEIMTNPIEAGKLAAFWLSEYEQSKKS